MLVFLVLFVCVCGVVDCWVWGLLSLIVVVHVDWDGRLIPRSGHPVTARRPRARACTLGVFHHEGGPAAPSVLEAFLFSPAGRVPKRRSEGSGADIHARRGHGAWSRCGAYMYLLAIYVYVLDLVGEERLLKWVCWLKSWRSG
jgi:hypothetical protein